MQRPLGLAKDGKNLVLMPLRQNFSTQKMGGSGAAADPGTLDPIALAPVSGNYQILVGINHRPLIERTARQRVAPAMGLA
jgi:hypothetical protein